MYGILVLALFAHPVALGAVVTAFTSQKRGIVVSLGATALLLGVLTIAVGVGGYLHGMSMVDEALLGVTSSFEAAMIREIGANEAAQNIRFGVIACAIPILAGFVATVRGATLGEKVGVRG